MIKIFSVLLLAFFLFQNETFANNSSQINAQQVKSIKCTEHIIAVYSNDSPLPERGAAYSTDFHSDVPAADNVYFLELELVNGHKQFISESKSFGKLKPLCEFRAARYRRMLERATEEQRELTLTNNDLLLEN